MSRTAILLVIVLTTGCHLNIDPVADADLGPRPDAESALDLAGPGALAPGDDLSPPAPPVDAAPVDAAPVDAAPGSDLSTAADLARGADLAPLADLAPEPDLTPAGCDNSASGATESRMRFPSDSVPYGSSCVGELQVRTCVDGTWSAWSGSFTFASCQVRPAQPCDGQPNGTIQHRTRFAEAVVHDVAACRQEDQLRTCVDGVWSAFSGSYAAESCHVDFRGTCVQNADCLEGACDGLLQRCQHGIGGACAANDDCDWSTTCLAGTCVPIARPGDVCDDDHDCGIADFTTCVGGRCRRALGAGCNANLECNNGTCIAARCRAISHPGDACDSGDSDDCQAPASCLAGRCALPDGAACYSNNDCRETCVGHSCTSRAAYGGSCDDDGDCGDRLACTVDHPSSGSLGTCLGAVYEPCSADSQCGGNRCECTDILCTHAMCTYGTRPADRCPNCAYRLQPDFWSTSAANCSWLAAGVDDIGSPCGLDVCNGSGGCMPR